MTSPKLEHKDYEWFNRALKAVAIADWLTVVISNGHLTLDEAKNWTPSQWKIATKSIGKDEPSIATRELIIAILEQRKL